MKGFAYSSGIMSATGDNAMTMHSCFDVSSAA
jgi:hypothetical protein